MGIWQQEPYPYPREIFHCKEQCKMLSSDLQCVPLDLSFKQGTEKSISPPFHVGRGMLLQMTVALFGQ